MLLEMLLSLSYGQLMGLAAIFYILSLGFAYWARERHWLRLSLFGILVMACEIMFMTGMSKKNIFGPDAMEMIITVTSIILLMSILFAFGYFADREESKAKARSLKNFRDSLK